MNWTRPAQAAEYVGVFPRTLNSWLKQDLRHSKIGNIVLIADEWLDDFIVKYSKRESDLDKIVREVMGK